MRWREDCKVPSLLLDQYRLTWQINTASISKYTGTNLFGRAVVWSCCCKLVHFYCLTKHGNVYF